MKNYVDVIARFDKSGKITPLKIRIGEFEVHMVDRVVDVRRAASLKSGGAGLRYTCYINGVLTYLFLDGGKWFYEPAV